MRVVNYPPVFDPKDIYAPEELLLWLNDKCIGHYDLIQDPGMQKVQVNVLIELCWLMFQTY